jgi:hypothetical protein
MKKITTVVVVCIISTQLIGQTKTKRQPPPPPEPPVEMTIPVPPPPPPAPPAPKTISDVEITSVAIVPAPPTPPLPPPPPPVPPTLPYRKVNERGYSMTIKTVNDKTTIKVKKGGFSEMIPLEKWNANKVFYEKRYGKLPLPAPAVEEVNFTPPVIEKNKED